MLKIANNATALIAGAINESADQIALASGGGALFPTLSEGDWFPLVVVDGSGLEIMRATGRTGDVLTVQRAQEGTVARSFGAGARADLRMTAATFADLEGQIASVLETLNTQVLALAGSIQAVADELPPVGTNDRLLAWVNDAYLWSQVTTAMIGDGSVTDAKLAADAVTTAKIINKAVTLAKMADGTGGDILYYNADGAPVRLPKGTDGMLLAMVAGMPAWISPNSIEFTGNFTEAKGHIRMGPFIVQWGTTVALGQSSSAQTFDTPFPNACLWVGPTPNSNNTVGGDKRDHWKATSYTTTGFTLNSWFELTSNTYKWMAIGW